MEISYVGENLFLGKLGNFSLSLAFASAILSLIAYLFHCYGKTSNNSWLNIGKQAFRVHTLAVISAIGTLFYILTNHHFEYHYAWQHTSKDLPFKYIFAAFWEGQEGSFLLWTFWHLIISNILIFTAKKWEAPVMVVISIVQAFLISMVLGIVIDIPGIIEYKIGSNPFILTREHQDMINLPFVKSPTYLQSLDGRGLNPALQNYWMTIHPPTLFLGFALTLVPYAYAIAGIWRGELKEWMRPALPWTFAGIMILGAGILMGGAWAYEALNFGGFWAWDPVENSPLVAWLVLAAGGHLMILPKKKGITLYASIIFSLFGFILILYSTFLTRSGILGDASVHSFTDLGMSGQLLVYLFFFIWFPSFITLRKNSLRFNYAVISIAGIIISSMLNFIIPAMFILFIISSIVSWYFTKKLNSEEKSREEDNIYSREFWMFVGALLLVSAGIHLTFETSKPVINKIFNTNYAPGDVDDYNTIQGAFAIVITILIAVGQFFRYNKTEPMQFWKNIIRSLGLSLALTIIAYLLFNEFRNPLYIILSFSSGFAFLSNLDYIIQFIKGKWKLAGASIAHIGFALIILGSVISAGHKKFISQNTSLINLEILNNDFKNNENIMLHKNDTVIMDEYLISYRGDTMIDHIAYYQVDYMKKSNNGIKNEFSLFPKLITNPRMGNVAEPSTKHFFGKDIFTHVTYVDLDRLKKRMALNGKKEEPEFNEPIHITLEKGDTIFGTSFYMVFHGFEALSTMEGLDDPNKLNVKLRGVFIANQMNGKSDTLFPIFEIKDSFQFVTPDFSEELGLRIVVDKILDEKQIEVSMQELKNNPTNDFIIMKAIIFPGINILWAGCFLLVLGSGLAILKRILH